MLTRIHGKIQFECDGCSDVFDSETSDFAEAREAMSREGWTSRKTGADWSHYCSTCKGRRP